MKLSPTGTYLSWNFPVTEGIIDDIAIDENGNSYYAISRKIFFDTYHLATLIRMSLPDGTVAGSAVLNGSVKYRPELHITEVLFMSPDIRHHWIFQLRRMLSR